MTKKEIIANTILEMKEKFTTKDLYEKLEKENITNKEIILDILSEMYENGLVNTCFNDSNSYSIYEVTKEIKR